MKFERSINLKPYLSQQSHARQAVYNLEAAIIHNGPLQNSGHYVALDVGTCENAIYNDESVSQKRKNFTDNIRVQREVYMLFYTRQSTHSGSGAEKVPLVVIDGDEDGVKVNADGDGDGNGDVDVDGIVVGGIDGDSDGIVVGVGLGLGDAPNNGDGDDGDGEEDGDGIGDSSEGKTSELGSTCQSHLKDVKSMREEIEAGEGSHIPGEKVFSFFPPISRESASTLYENYGVGQKDKTIGGDLKPMEYPVENDSYSVASPGQINDVVFLAYLELLTESAREADIELVTYDTNFFTKLREVCDLHCNRNEQHKRVKPMTELCGKFHRNYDLTAADYLVFPVHKPGHWIIVIGDIQQKEVVLFDPLSSGT